LADILRGILMYVVAPLWILAGLADWWCHRRTFIELTSGWRESAFHLVLFGQMGIAVIAAIFLETNAALLAVLGVFFLVHELTTLMELRLVSSLRNIRPIEQMVHSFLELLPLLAFLLLAVLSSDETKMGARLEAGWSLKLRTQSLPAPYLATLLLGVVFLNLLPLVEEAIRCARVHRGRHSADVSG
jgi:hypothetical protein